MHTMQRGRGEDRNLWTVGFFAPKVEPGGGPWYDWIPLEDFNSKAEAAAFVNYLNGGAGTLFVSFVPPKK